MSTILSVCCVVFYWLSRQQKFIILKSCLYINSCKILHFNNLYCILLLFLSTIQVQIDPYLEDSPCSVCSVQQGPYFCRELVCFRYFCRSCWTWHHGHQNIETLMDHKPLMRNSKNTNIISMCSPPMRPFTTGNQ